MVSTVGPVSNSYPPPASRPARPPGTDSRSTTVTCRPAAARCKALARPPSPAPTTITRSVGPVTVRIIAPGSVVFSSCRAMGGADGEVDQRGAGRFVDRCTVHRFDALRHPLADERLDLGRGSGVGDHLGQVGDVEGGWTAGAVG